MNFDSITTDLLEKAEACETPQELMELAQDSGIDLTDADLDMIAGGDNPIGPLTEEALKKMTPEERAKAEELGEVMKKWLQRERHPGWQGH